MISDESPSINDTVPILLTNESLWSRQDVSDLTPLSAINNQDQAPMTTANTAAKHRFHRVQLRADMPDLQGWYLELGPDDVDTLMAVHRSVAGVYFFKFGMDPHYQSNETLREHYHPAKLAAGWLQSVERYLLAGKSVLVNCYGGILPMEDAIILETVESEDIDWDTRYEDEEITISRWPEGRHYWLVSNKHRAFVPNKYDSYTQAYTAALRFVPAGRIKTKC